MLSVLELRLQLLSQKLLLQRFKRMKVSKPLASLGLTSGKAYSVSVAVAEPRGIVVV